MIKSNRRYHYNTKRKTILRLFVLIAVVVALILVAIFNKATIEKFFGLNRQLIQSQNQVYLLKYSTFDSFETAYSASEKIKSVGGAGFIKQTNQESFNVYIATYPTQEKANKVKQELLKNNLECEIERIDFNSFVLKNSQPNIIKHKECLRGHLDNYFLLYEVFESHTDKTLDVVTKQKLNTIYYDYKSKCEKLFSEKEKGQEIEICSIYINNVLNILENLINYQTDINWSLQYSLIKLIWEYQGMLKAVNY
ncbi:MAG: hypothetical protein IJW82_00145 [Clostridia bacterium]|nr:hypothetical protein [Clostridia bacterium]